MFPAHQTEMTTIIPLQKITPSLTHNLSCTIVSQHEIKNDLFFCMFFYFKMSRLIQFVTWFFFVIVICNLQFLSENCLHQISFSALDETKYYIFVLIEYLVSQKCNVLLMLLKGFSFFVLSLHLFSQRAEFGTGPSFKCDVSSVFQSRTVTVHCVAVHCLISSAVHHIQHLNARIFSSTCRLFQKLWQSSQKHT